MNLYGESAVPSGSLEPVLQFNTGENSYRLVKCVFWGDVAAEFVVKRNDEVLCGGRTSDAQRTLQLDFKDSPFMFGPNELVVVYGEHYVTGAHVLKGNLYLSRI